MLLGNLEKKNREKLLVIGATRCAAKFKFHVYYWQSNYDAPLTNEYNIFIALQISAYCILRKMRKLYIGCTIFVQRNFMRNIYARSAKLRTSFVNAQYMRNICTRFFPHAVHNICATFSQDCTSFPNVQYKRRIALLSPMHNIFVIYAQDLRKIVLLSQMPQALSPFVHSTSSFSRS